MENVIQLRPARHLVGDASYAEASYFDGFHFHHCAARDDHLRLERLAQRSRAMIERRTGSRGIRP